MLEVYGKTAPKAMDVLEQSFEDVMAVMSIPIKYRKRLRTSNSIERPYQEIHRRKCVFLIFPNEASLIRVIGALLMEMDERWSSGKKHFLMEEYLQFESTN